MKRTGNIVEGPLKALDEQDYERLVPIAKRLCRAAPELDPRDLVQEAVRRFLDHFRPERGREPRVWLISVMTRHFYDLLGKAKVRQKVAVDPTLTRWTQAQDVSHSPYEHLTPERFAWAVDQLSEQQRVTFLLRCQGLKNPEIALKLGVDVAKVAKRYFDARVKLGVLLKPYVDEELP